MRIHTHLPLALLGLFALVAPRAEAQQLDYARTLHGPDMVFVPTLGTNRGPIFYTRYEQVAPTSSTALGDFRRMIINLWPTAHRPVTQYNNFLTANAITDAKQLAVPTYGACEPTQAIKDRLAHMPDGFKPAALPGTYPIICKLSLYFLPEEEADVRAMIAAGPVMTLQGSVPLCDESSPQVKVPEINQRLTTDGVLTTNTAAEVTGNSWNVLYESARLAVLSPSLFGTPDPQVGWEVYAKSFVMDLTAQTAVMSPATASQPQYVCTPEPLVLQFGL
ncbi:MAG TPA: hypothetical protein VFZ09_09305 [Archangium sp.]|uniref:hypothetical protein n=1 Tax=Archangium sp. TaxID=1872627 RepID=UPI002E310FAF|nr:hypothetical protein [Archangium sp.]HEX5746431.1 hypothetical protein [Archangium sp.]